MSELLDCIARSDADVRGMSFFAEDVSAATLGHVEFEDCVFESCGFAELKAARMVFDRCRFVSCDFSNARLATSFWRDCTLKESRLVGCDLHGSYLVRDSLVECVCSYASLAQSKLEQVSLVSCDLHEASLSQLQLRRKLTLDGCDLTRAELFGTRLRGVDLSTCALEGVRFSEARAELQGAKVALDQAPELLALLGVQLV